MKLHKKSMNRRVRGQGMSEYLVIVGMIAVAGIVVSGLFGETLRGSFSTLATNLAGTDSTASVAVMDTANTAAATNAAVDSNMGNTLVEYGGANR